ncbi:hypothetical protein TcYC6_0002200 [Trypanosoma cruzi]|nr:hypothetical protein TcYC6_0002200 [Trypanosoma cruzi]
MGECWPCSTGSRAWAVAPNAGSESPASGCVWVSARQEYSRQHLASAVAAQCSIVGPQLLLHRVDGLLRRLYSIHFASAFIHADGRTLVALCADIRACGAAMPTAVSPITTWAAERSLSISADRSGAALFCIASHRQSDEDTADHRLGDGNPRVKSHPVRLLGNAIDRHPNFDYARFHRRCRADVPRRHQLRLGAEAGASQHTTRYFLVGCVHSALHHGGEAIAPCPAPIHLHGLEVRRRDSCTASLGPRAAKKDTSVHLAANSAPLRRIIGFRAPTQYERHVRFHNHGICAPLSTRNLCLRPCRKSGDIDPASERCCY